MEERTSAKRVKFQHIEVEAIPPDRFKFPGMEPLRPLEHLGDGSEGDVYLAEGTRSGNKMALKRIEEWDEGTLENELRLQELLNPDLSVVTERVGVSSLDGSLLVAMRPMKENLFDNLQDPPMFSWENLKRWIWPKKDRWLAWSSV